MQFVRPVLALALALNLSACSKNAEQAITEAVNAAAPITGGSGGGGGGAAGAARPAGTNGAAVLPAASAGTAAPSPTCRNPMDALRPGARPDFSLPLCPPSPGAPTAQATARMRGGQGSVTVTVVQENPGGAGARREPDPIRHNDLITTHATHDEIPLLMPSGCGAEPTIVTLRLRKGSWREMGNNHYVAETAGEQTLRLPNGETRISGPIEVRDLPVMQLSGRFKRLTRARLGAQTFPYRAIPHKVDPRHNELVIPPAPNFPISGGELALNYGEGNNKLYSWSMRYRVGLSGQISFPWSAGNRSSGIAHFAQLVTLQESLDAETFCHAFRNEGDPQPYHAREAYYVHRSTFATDQIVGLYGPFYKVRGGTPLVQSRLQGDQAPSDNPHFLCPEAIETVDVSEAEALTGVFALRSGRYEMGARDPQPGMSPRCAPELPIRFEKPVRIHATNGLEIYSVTAAAAGTRDNFSIPLHEIREMTLRQRGEHREATYQLASFLSPVYPSGLENAGLAGLNFGEGIASLNRGSYHYTSRVNVSPSDWVIRYPQRTVYRQIPAQTNPRREERFVPEQLRASETRTQLRGPMLVYSQSSGSLGSMTAIVAYQARLRWHGVERQVDAEQEWANLPSGRVASQRRYCLVTFDFKRTEEQTY